MDKPTCTNCRTTSINKPSQGPVSEFANQPERDRSSRGHQAGDQVEDWRPSYMFHWPKALGKSIKEAYDAFEEYEGKVSYEQLGLESPEPMQQNEGYTDEWSHMSDHDGM